MKKIITLPILIALATYGCSTTSSNVNGPISHAPITSKSSKIYIDLSENDRCLIKEQPAIENKKLAIRPILNADGIWECETKPVIYKIKLHVKNTKKEEKDYTLICDNQYGLMKDCKGWNDWINDLGDGPFVIEAKGNPEKIQMPAKDSLNETVKNQSVKQSNTGSSKD